MLTFVFYPVSDPTITEYVKYLHTDKLNLILAELDETHLLIRESAVTFVKEEVSALFNRISYQFSEDRPG